MNQGETTPMAPFVAGNRVIVGPSGGEFGIYGWVKGLDLATGKILWTAHNMGPDSSMLARPGRGRYTGDANIGVSSWEGDSWRRAGVGLDLLRPAARLDLLRHGQSRPLQHRAASRREQVDQQRPGAPAGRRFAGVGLSVHAARQLGL